MSSSQSSVSPSQLFRRLSTAPSTDLSDGIDLLDITFSLVLRNLLRNVKRCSSKVYPLLKIVVPYIILLTGVYEAAQSAGSLQSFANSAVIASASTRTEVILTAAVSCPTHERQKTDKRVEQLFADLPNQCIALLEDIDCAGLKRELSSDEGHSNYKDFEKANKAGLTLSGLLNCLDGPMSKDGRIVCMTSNAPDNLDHALVRPGRCDHKVHFGCASEEIYMKLFEHLYTKRPDELVDGKASLYQYYDISSLAQDFASAIPPDSMITPAEVQGYLMIHRKDPQAAVEGAAAFAEQIIETKERGANVAAHANEIRRKRKRSRTTWERTDEQGDIGEDDDKSSVSGSESELNRHEMSGWDANPPGTAGGDTLSPSTMIASITSGALNALRIIC